jgi:hypothetical protein
VSNQVVKEHRGHISVESAHGKGTSILVEIPVGQSAYPDSPGRTIDPRKHEAGLEVH